MKNTMMKATVSLVVLVSGLCNVAFAQTPTVEVGKQFLYYHRYKSANDIFDKVLASNPNNIDAIYWKGQCLFDQKDSAAAGDLYSKALQTNGSAPLLLVGMGGYELRMGKTADAKQRFETAITLTKGKDINVLNAVADNNIDAPAGDAQYAIEKLTQATQIKGFHDATTYVLMGDAYRKLIDGGNAVIAYQKALTIDPKLAEAKFEIGRIYQTQNNPEYYMPAFEDAIQMDPNYAPAYYALYNHYFFHGDVDKSTEFLNKYIAVADPSSQNDYDLTAMLFLQKKYDDAISASKKAITTLGDKVYPKYYLLIAYCYDAKGDSVNARDYLTQYFAKAKPDVIAPPDYVFLGKVQSQFPSDSAASIASYRKAIDMDTVLANKLKIIKDASDQAKATGHKAAYAYWLGVAYPFIKAPAESDLYNWGFANYSAGNYKTADSIFCGIYETQYPSAVFGYFWCARSKTAEDDTLGSQGLALEPNIKFTEMARAYDSTSHATGKPDSTRWKNQIVNTYFAIAQHYNDIKKDKESAIAYLRKILEVDPTNTTAAHFLDLMTRKPVPKAPAKPKAAK
jgi:tetratricopeptide (TPR) repeat protein